MKKSHSQSNPLDVMLAETPFTDPFSCFSGIVPFYKRQFTRHHLQQVTFSNISDLRSISCSFICCVILPLLARCSWSSRFPFFPLEICSQRLTLNFRFNWKELNRKKYSFVTLPWQAISNLEAIDLSYHSNISPCYTPVKQASAILLKKKKHMRSVVPVRESHWSCPTVYIGYC